MADRLAIPSWLFDCCRRRARRCASHSGTRLGLLSLMLLVPAMGCGGPSAASLLATAPTYDPPGQTKCSVTRSNRRPLVIEWPSADRAALEALAKRGLVAVRYEGCEMELLAQCRVGGGYRYTPTTTKQETVTIRDVDDLYAKVPLGAASLEAKLARAGQLVVAMSVVGRYDADRDGAAAADLEGLCSRATHVVTGLTAGAFEFYAGGAAEVGAGVEVAGVGAGARSEASRELLNRDGDPAACASATTSDTQPPEGCGALLRVEVTPLGAAAGRPTAVAAGAADGEGAIRPDGAVIAGEPARAAGGGDGIPPGPGIVHVRLSGEDTGLQLYGTGVSKLQPLADGTYRSVGESTILCTSPCDSYIDARVGQTLYVEGPETPSSPPFWLYDQQGDVTLEVESGNSVLAGIGGAAAAIGVIGLLVGLPVAITGTAVEGADSDVSIVGWSTTAGSAVLFGVGLPMSIVGTTGVEIVPTSK